MLPLIEEVLGELKKHEGKPSGYNSGKGGYWDDFCLAKFLEGICLRYIAYPVSPRLIVIHFVFLIHFTSTGKQDPDAVFESEEKLSISSEEAQKRSLAAFDAVFAYGAKIQLDHFIVYYTRTSLTFFFHVSVMFARWLTPTCFFRFYFDTPVNLPHSHEFPSRSVFRFFRRLVPRFALHARG